MNDDEEIFDEDEIEDDEEEEYLSLSAKKPSSSSVSVSVTDDDSKRLKQMGMSIMEDEVESDEERKLRLQLEELEKKALKRQERSEQKARVRQLKKQIRKAEIGERVAPITEPLSPIGREIKKTGKGFYNFGKAFVKSSRERADAEAISLDTKGEPGKGKVALSVSEGKPSLLSFSREPGTSSVLGGQKFEFGRKGGMLSPTTRRGSDVGMVMGRRTDFDWSLGRGGMMSTERVPVKRKKKKKARGKPVKKAKPQKVVKKKARGKPRTKYVVVKGVAYPVGKTIRNKSKKKRRKK